MARIQHFLLVVLTAHILTNLRFVVGEDSSGSGSGSKSKSNDITTTVHGKVPATPASNADMPAAADASSSSSTTTAAAAATSTAFAAASTTQSAFEFFPQNLTSSLLDNTFGVKLFATIIVVGVWAIAASVTTVFWRRRASNLKFQLDLSQQNVPSKSRSSHLHSTSPQPKKTKTPKPCNRLRPETVFINPNAPAPSATKKVRPSSSSSFTFDHESPRYVDLEEITIEIDGVPATVSPAAKTTTRTHTLAFTLNNASQAGTTPKSKSAQPGRCHYVQPGDDGQRCKRNAAAGTDGTGYCTKHSCPSFGCPNSKPSVEILCVVCAVPPQELYEEPCTQAPLLYDAANSDTNVHADSGDLLDSLPPLWTASSIDFCSSGATANGVEAYPLLGIMVPSASIGHGDTGTLKSSADVRDEPADATGFGANAAENDTVDCNVDGNADSDGVYGVMIHAGFGSMDDIYEDLEL